MSNPADTKAPQDDWPRRLALSLLFGTGSVLASAMFFIVFASNTPSKAMDFASYVIAIPLLPGVGFVSLFFNAWQAVHQGQIALVPIVSVPVDTVNIFTVWQLLRKRKPPLTENHTVLHLGNS